MAQVYDFNSYRLPRLLRSFSRQAEDVARLADEQKLLLTCIERSLSEMEDAVAKFDNQLSSQRERLEETLESAHSCQDAAESGSLDQMIAARERIIRAHASLAKTH